MRNSCTMPIYQQIALDIANQIYTGILEEGSTIYGRSILAGKYSVSPETIRRAVKILEDLGVVTSVKGKGIIITSPDKALLFIKKYENITNISTYKTTLHNLINTKATLESDIISTINKIIEYSDRLEVINPLIPVQFQIEHNCKHIGKTAAETNFWQNTGATIVAIKRGDDLIISPGPYIEFLENDILLLVGDKHIHNAVPVFLYEG